MAQSIPQLYEPHSAAANTLPWVLHAIARTALMKRFSAEHDSALQSDPTRAQIEASVPVSAWVRMNRNLDLVGAQRLN